MLATLLLVVVATALDSSSWLRGLRDCALTAAIACGTERFMPRRWLFKTLANARPLPLGAVDVSDSERDVFLFGAVTFVTYMGAAAVMTLLFRDGGATEVATFAGASTGLAVWAVRNSRIISRWEADNGRLYTEGRSGIRRKGLLYVEDPAAAPLDAS